MRNSLRDLIPNLPRRAWQVLAGDALSALGTGLVLPFLVVYMRDVRGFEVSTAGFIIAAMAVVSLVTGPPAGSLVDRIGARPMLLASLVLCSAGSILTSFATVPWQALGAVSVIGVGFSALWPATHSLLTSLVDRRHRSAVYAVHYATLNAGIGVGGIIGGLMANVNDASSFELLYRLDALSWLAFAAVLLMLKGVGAKATNEEGSEEVAGGYRDVIADRVAMRLVFITVLMVTIGYSQLESGFPAYVTGDGGATTRLLGLAFAANTFVIVGAQLFVLRWLEGKRRTRAMMAICTMWAVAWSLTLGAGQLDPGVIKNLGFVLALVAFALGECLVSPSIPGMLNDLAPDRLRGRYNAAYSLTFSSGHIFGPAMAGLMLGRDLGAALFLGLTAACLAMLFVIRDLEKRAPEAVNRISSDDEPLTESVGDSVITVV